MLVGAEFYAPLAADIRAGLGSAEVMEHLRGMWWSRYTESTPDGLEQHLALGSASYVFDRAGDSPGASQPDRTVAAYGFVEPPEAAREGGYQARFPLGDRFGTPVHRGHMMPHTAGGLYGPNLFPQQPALNCGWSRSGREYRELEERAVARGLFFFCALVYCDDGDMPAYVELGVVEDRVLTVKHFRNRFDAAAAAALPPSTAEILDSLTTGQFGDVGEEVVRAHLEDELGWIIVLAGDSGLERGERGEQDLDIVAALDGELIAVEVKTRNTGRLAGVRTRAGNLRKPRLQRAGAGVRQGSIEYAAARLQGYVDIDGAPRIVVAVVDLPLGLVQFFDVVDGRVKAAAEPPQECGAAIGTALTVLGYT